MMKKPTKLNRIQLAGLEDLPIQIWYMESLQKYGPANHAHCRFVETDAEALMTHSLDAITNIEIKTKFRRLYEERFSGSNITTSELRFPESQQLLEHHPFQWAWRLCLEAADFQGSAIQRW